jgi:Helix-turn-helix domain
VAAHPRDRIEMSQRERDKLKVMHGVLKGERSQAEAARLLRLSVRHVRRLQRRLEAGGDGALAHGLRGRPSNRRAAPGLRAAVVKAYRDDYPDFGPTLAAEKLAGRGLAVGAETLRRWLLAAGLWQRRRRREPHRSRRPRRACFGELVQIDASVHDWLEGRGEAGVLIGMIDDATGRVLARFYPAGTTEAHMDLFGRWLRRHGRPLALYSDRHSIFEPQDKGKLRPGAETQFGRACRELDIELIRAHSPQAKGRVERLFGTAQDRWVKELRLAGARTLAEANRLLPRLLAGHNRRFARPAAKARDAHRALGPGHRLEAVLSIQEQRVVSNDYVVRYRGRFYQLLPPAWPGLRGGRVVIEERPDGTTAIRFGQAYLKYREAAGARRRGGAAPTPPEFSASAADASGGEEGPAPRRRAGPAGMQPPGGRSGRTPALPCPPAGAAKDSAKGPWRPPQNHPWRRRFKRQK